MFAVRRDQQRGVLEQLLERGDTVVGLDNFNDYYDVNLKEARAAILDDYEHFSMVRIDLADRDAVEALFAKEKFDKVIHLAAQAGVRYSLENPAAYIDSNLVAFANLLECCRHHSVEHLVYASSSSVYGANTAMPFSIHQNVDHPLALYGATKKANELMAHTYSHLYDLPTTGLRFFTVYGPWDRPDMALQKFAKAITNDESIKLFNYGNHRRDFTYIDDIIEGVVRVMGRLPEANPSWSGDAPDPGTSSAPYKVYNIGNNNPVELNKFIEVIEEILGKKAQKKLMDIQPGDVAATYADVDDLMEDVGFKTDTPIEVGIARFVEWFKEYYEY